MWQQICQHSSSCLQAFLSKERAHLSELLVAGLHIAPAHRHVHACGRAVEELAVGTALPWACNGI